MDRRINLIWAAILVSSVLILSGAFEPAASRSRGAALLSLCIRNYERCFHSCYDFDSALPPDAGAGYCWAHCDANHAACVDQAFEPAARAYSRAYRKARQRLLRDRSYQH